MDLIGLGMVELEPGIYAKAVNKGRCTREFGRIRKEVGRGFSYYCISAGIPDKTNGYSRMIANIKVDYSEQNLIIINTNEQE